MANLILALVCALIASLVVFKALPWLAKTASIYALHTLRDRLYAVSARLPAVLETLVYRDIEFLLCFFIHTCRDKGSAEARDLALVLHDLKPQMPSAWRRDVYARELKHVYAGADGAAALIEVYDVFQRAKLPVFLAALASNPIVLIAVALAGIFVVAYTTLGRLFSVKPAPSEIIPNAVEAVLTFSRTRATT